MRIKHDILSPLSLLLNTLLMWVSKSLWHVRIATNPPDSPVLHLTHLFSTWFICFPPDSPVFTQFTCYQPGLPVLSDSLALHLVNLFSTRFTNSSNFTRFHLIYLLVTWFTCSPPDSHVFHLIHLFSPDFTLFQWKLSPTNHLFFTRFTCSPPDSHVFHLTLLFTTWVTCFPIDSPVFIRYHPLSLDWPVLQMIHLFSSWFTCFPPNLPIFARFHPVFTQFTCSPPREKEQ